MTQCLCFVWTDKNDPVSVLCVDLPEAGCHGTIGMLLAIVALLMILLCLVTPM